MNTIFLIFGDVNILLIACNVYVYANAVLSSTLNPSHAMGKFDFNSVVPIAVPVLYNLQINITHVFAIVTDSSFVCLA